MVDYTCVDQFNGITKQAFFGVFDGHGGKTISEFCANRMHVVLMSLLKDSGYKNIAKCIERTFTQVDDESRALDPPKFSLRSSMIVLETLAASLFYFQFYFLSVRAS